jgi:hypothetical protein
MWVQAKQVGLYCEAQKMHTLQPPYFSLLKGFVSLLQINSTVTANA